MAQSALSRRTELTPLVPLRRGQAAVALTEGNRVRLLTGGAQAFPAMLAAIERAQREVWLESYIIAADGTGRAFLDALIAVARKGREVRLICDGVGSLGVPAAWFEELRRAGGRHLVYHPPLPWRSGWGLWRRDHRKTLIVDHGLGFVGGVNLADEYDQRTEAGRQWSDLHMQVEGPAAVSLAHLFARTWNRAMPRADRLTCPRIHEGSREGGVPVAVVGNRETRYRFLIRRTFLHVARRAQRSILVANPYFIPDGTVSRALRRAAAAGVDVRVVIPARSDIRIIDLACRAALPRLLAAGVRVAEWPGMMHAKAAVVDGMWASVGSYNLDRRALHFNLEVTANVYDAAFAGTVEESLRDHFAAADELSSERLRLRPWWERALSALAYRLRALL